MLKYHVVATTNIKGGNSEKTPMVHKYHVVATTNIKGGNSEKTPMVHKYHVVATTNIKGGNSEKTPMVHKYHVVATTNIKGGNSEKTPMVHKNNNRHHEINPRITTITWLVSGTPHISKLSPLLITITNILQICITTTDDDANFFSVYGRKHH